MDNTKRGLTHHIVSGLLWTAWGNGAQAILQLVVLAFLARLLRPADFGVVTAAMIVVGFSEIFSKLGLGPALVQRPELEPRHLRTAFSVSILLGFLTGGIIWITAPVAADFFRNEGVEPVLKVLAWVFPLKGLAVMSESLASRELRFRWLANIQVVCFAGGYGLVGVGLGIYGYGAWALVAATLAQSLLKTAILLFAFPPPKRPVPERRAFAELIYFSGGFTAARLSNYLALQGDYLVVGRWLGPVALGLYGRSYQLMGQPALLFGRILDDVLFPAMAKVQGQKERLATAYTRGVALIGLVILPTSVTLYVLAPELIYVVLGPQWNECVVPFQILIIGMLFRTSYKMSDSLTRATGAVYRRAWRQVAYAVLVVGGAWAGQHWGITGVALGVLVALAVNFTIMAQLSLNLSGITWWDFGKAHAPALMLAAVSGVIAATVAAAFRRYGLHPLWSLIASGGVTLVCAILFMRHASWLFLGREGLWMVEVLRTRVQELLKPYFPRGAGAVIRETAVPEVSNV